MYAHTHAHTHTHTTVCTTYVCTHTYTHTHTQLPTSPGMHCLAPVEDQHSKPLIEFLGQNVLQSRDMLSLLQVAFAICGD